jgi:hypothetical protein
MKTDSNDTFTIALSGTFTIAREELESVLINLIVQGRDVQPNVEVVQTKPTAKSSGHYSASHFRWESADILGVCYDTVRRLVQRGLLKCWTAMRHKKIPNFEIEGFLKETTRLC